MNNFRQIEVKIEEDEDESESHIDSKKNTQLGDKGTSKSDASQRNSALSSLPLLTDTKKFSASEICNNGGAKKNHVSQITGEFYKNNSEITNDYKKSANS